jgi:hypothetical protein
VKRLSSRFRALISALKDQKPAETIPLDRAISSDERTIAEWLLLHSDPSALSFLSQLDNIRVIGQCSCGCPTVDLRVSEGTLPADFAKRAIGDALGEVNGNTVGVMLLQSDGHLTCLEVYDLTDIRILMDCLR